MATRGSRADMLWPLTLLALIARPGATTDVTAPPMTSLPDDALHVHLHNETHGEMEHEGSTHDVHATVLEHNSTHSVLHVNSSTAGLHRDVLVHKDVLDDMGMGADPINGTHLNHSSWNGNEQLVPTKGGWMTEVLNSSVSVENRQQEMMATDVAHQSTVHFIAATVGACVGVAILAAVVCGVFRVRRPADAPLLSEEDEEFTVFSVVDHPYPGKKGDNYVPLQ
ncbi:uncharacterized protein LOC122373591 [Amphibalanus amphitrite]|uniref:uncharacterized protein LOC122373591 n=1 Tax=Amphibalanus amphitrite TaxID=1232801 RepID=UPI001C920833|nr:uncharacterized protein LOC122373591 [Amphibalanus amphitrite]XP_043207748.1 uncharacterized protein LOC122373591 [Amphibalanus amphitrite]XP_043207749.1 uncharacterized protein LOC122373591 [Amphibalanus amphitrite]XP_043207750.1 uncharacterized protein LOC122373591 [Amphibalanus amphitrite]XP_043207751.1 uncharacterized protein LOC122373591 [Amphibalanus amphitrite]